MSVMTEGQILRRAAKREPILVAGERVSQVRSQGRMLKAEGYVATSKVLQSEVTHDYYQWWVWPTKTEDSSE